MQQSEKKNKHMTLDDRIEIQECLAKGMTFKAIGKRVGKSPTTISREIKLHMEPYINGFSRIDAVCPLLLKAPFVCNGCDKKSKSSYRSRSFHHCNRYLLHHLDVLRNLRSSHINRHLRIERAGAQLRNQNNRGYLVQFIICLFAVYFTRVSAVLPVCFKIRFNYDMSISESET